MANIINRLLYFKDDIRFSIDVMIAAFSDMGKAKIKYQENGVLIAWNPSSSAMIPAEGDPGQAVVSFSNGRYVPLRWILDTKYIYRHYVILKRLLDFFEKKFQSIKVLCREYVDDYYAVDDD